MNWFNLLNSTLTVLVSGATITGIGMIIQNILEHRRGVIGVEIEADESLLDRLERLYIAQEKRVKEYEEQLAGLRDINLMLRTELFREKMFTDILENHINLEKGPPAPKRPFS